MNTEDTYHYESEEELVMALMNEGWTREYAERQVAHKKEEAYWQAQEVIAMHFIEVGELP